MPAIPEPIAVEARAKIIWGESVDKVRAFLRAKNIGEQDAAVLIEEIMAERTEQIRDDGKKKLWIGSAFVAAPIVFYFVSEAMGFMMLKGARRVDCAWGGRRREAHEGPLDGVEPAVGHGGFVERERIESTSCQCRRAGLPRLVHLVQWLTS